MKKKEQSQEKRYYVQKALQMRMLGGNKDQTEYLIKWEGYPIEESTWEPHWSLFEDCKQIIDDYKKYLKKFKEYCVNNKNTKYKYQRQNDLYYVRFDLKNNPLSKEEICNLENQKYNYKLSSQKKVQNKSQDKYFSEGIKTRNQCKEDKIFDQESINVIGSLDQNDKVDKILEVRKHKNQHIIQFLVSWHKRKNGIQPEPSQISNLQLREHNKNILLDFYESKLTIKENK